MNKIFKFAKKKNPFNSLIQNQKYFLHFPEQRFGGITRNVLKKIDKNSIINY